MSRPGFNSIDRSTLPAEVDGAVMMEKASFLTWFYRLRRYRARCQDALFRGWDPNPDGTVSVSLVCARCGAVSDTTRLQVGSLQQETA